ncbi:unnamed protein product [Penicillium roqueforti FM164]|uniref:Genomic scaffold, ProqFM164S01 n=1 Tax=Penicillium roqueforti (strain FM164) TaxID=1365484 RepID=W6Q0Q0_PENRF|nr:unnamed protein product [Penicillium roqueforti FM164]
MYRCFILIFVLPAVQRCCIYSFLTRIPLSGDFCCCCFGDRCT